MRLQRNTRRGQQKPSGKSSKELRLFWDKLFGFKIGDVVRVKYGKVSWEIWNLFMYNKRLYLKVRRFRRDRNGRLQDTVHSYFYASEVIKVQAKEDVDTPFPSNVFR